MRRVGGGRDNCALVCAITFCVHPVKPNRKKRNKIFLTYRILSIAIPRQQHHFRAFFSFFFPNQIRRVDFFFLETHVTRPNSLFSTLAVYCLLMMGWENECVLIWSTALSNSFRLNVGRSCFEALGLLCFQVKDTRTSLAVLSVERTDGAKFKNCATPHMARRELCFCYFAILLCCWSSWKLVEHYRDYWAIETWWNIRSTESFFLVKTVD